MNRPTWGESNEGAPHGRLDGRPSGEKTPSNGREPETRTPARGEEGAANAFQAGMRAPGSAFGASRIRRERGLAGERRLREAPEGWVRKGRKQETRLLRVTEIPPTRMKLIGGRELFFSETFILPEGESAKFDAAARGFPLRIEVTAEKVPGGLRAQATTNVVPATDQEQQAGIGPLLAIRLENWNSSLPAIFLKPVRFGQLPDGTSLGYTLSVTAISGPPTARIISLQVYVGGNY